MALAKIGLLNDTQKRKARLARALGHPSRISISRLVAYHLGCTCSSITD